MSTKKIIPTFSSEDEEREFWDTHDATDYIDWSTAHKIDLSHLRPDSRDPNPFSEIALLLSEGHPGWVLLDFKATAVSEKAWQLLRILAATPDNMVPFKKLESELGEDTKSITNLVNEIRHAFGERSPGLGRENIVIDIPEKGAIMSLDERNILLVPMKAGARSSSPTQ